MEVYHLVDALFSGFCVSFFLRGAPCKYATSTDWSSNTLDSFLFDLFAAIVLAPSLDISHRNYRMTVHVSYMMTALIACFSRASRSARSSSP